MPRMLPTTLPHTAPRGFLPGRLLDAGPQSARQLSRWAGIRNPSPTEPTQAAAANGSCRHGQRFPPPKLNAGCRFRKETIAGMRRNGRDAPIPVVRAP